GRSDAPMLYLFDDARARAWLPFRVTRPVGEILFGCMKLRERIERAFGAPASGHLAGDTLAGYGGDDVPPVVDPDELPLESPRLLVSSRFVPRVPGPELPAEG